MKERILSNENWEGYNKQKTLWDVKRTRFKMHENTWKQFFSLYSMCM